MIDIESVFNTLQSEWPTKRPTGTLPSRVTSVDAKLCYNQSKDTFCSFLLGDINANPGGIQDRSNKCKRDIENFVSDSFISNIPGDNLHIAVILPAEVYDDCADQWVSPSSWYTRDRRAIVRALDTHERVSSIVHVTDCSRLSHKSGTLTITDRSKNGPVSGYVNLDDTGLALSDALGNDVEMMSKGANAPTAVWNPRFNETGKHNLLRTAMDYTSDIANVRVPRFKRVESLIELKQFHEDVGDIILKSPFGTHGNEVVPIRENELPLHRIEAAEARVRDAIGHPEFQIYDETEDAFVFNARGWESGHGIVEEAITGKIRREKYSFEVLELDVANSTYPVDFVPLAVCRGDGQSEIPSIMVRTSTVDSLNANLHSKSMMLEALPVAFNNEMDIRVDGKTLQTTNIQQEAEQIAQRPVSIEELRQPLQQAGQLALLVRNQTALQIEQTL